MYPVPNPISGAQQIMTDPDFMEAEAYTILGVLFKKKNMKLQK